MPPDCHGAGERASSVRGAAAVDLDAVLRRELCLQVGRARRFSCEELGDALEVAPRRIKAIRDGEQRAGLDLGLRIAALLGPGSLNRLLLAVGYVARPVEDEDGEAAAWALLGELGREVASLSDALADGRIDHRERAKLARELQELVGKVASVAVRMEREQP